MAWGVYSSTKISQWEQGGTTTYLSKYWYGGVQKSCYQTVSEECQNRANDHMSIHSRTKY